MVCYNHICLFFLFCYSKTNNYILANYFRRSLTFLMPTTTIFGGVIIKKPLDDIKSAASTSRSSDDKEINEAKFFHQKKMNLIDSSYELIDPNPNIYELFVLFSDQFFYGALGACTVEWSKRMTL